METQTETKPKAKAPAEERLRNLGLSTAANNVSNDRNLARKMRIAYEFHRVVTPEQIVRFNEKLAANTRKDEGKNAWGTVHTKDVLRFTPIENYAKVPPGDVLDKLEEAKERACFDSYEIATIASVRVIPDPILFGIINGCPDKYFVAQWDSDLKIEDILREDEG